MEKKVYSFRVDEEILGEVKKMKLNIPDFLEKQLEKLLNKKRCPTCGKLKETDGE